MTKRTNPHSFGLVFGIFLAVWHALWSFLVWLGAAQPLIHFIFRLRMITPPNKIAAFNLRCCSRRGDRGHRICDGLGGGLHLESFRAARSTVSEGILCLN